MAVISCVKRAANTVVETCSCRLRPRRPVLNAESAVRRGEQKSLRRVIFPPLGFYSCGKWTAATESAADLLVKPASFAAKVPIHEYAIIHTESRNIFSS